jgi:hypothetical protein
MPGPGETLAVGGQKGAGWARVSLCACTAGEPASNASKEKSIQDFTTKAFGKRMGCRNDAKRDARWQDRDNEPER